MATIVRFEDLDIWKEARSLSCEIIQIVNVTELKGDYKLRDQIKGSSGSVMDNIAEGFERDGNLEFRQFLSVAKGSAGETRSQIYRVYDSGYISEKEMIRLTVEYEKLSRRIANFITYLNKKDFKGIKFK
ncbi:four helix bundle protein [Arenibacter palladensis]|uniref:four helix bundle protein n=1 Tax=Arenibacter palladensis TaxID=237373 RepID=UPI0026E15D46|nr:four helix bundle protein [Arenibacter palladensis]MDO6604273.1 four helix bundle protein [Arenibacter palladensis]